MDYVIDLYKEVDEDYFKGKKGEVRVSKVIDINKARRGKRIKEKMCKLYGGVR